MAVRALEETLSSAVYSATNIELFGYFNFSLSGTFVGTVVVQRSFDGGVHLANH